MKNLLTILLVLSVYFSFSQQTFYDVTAGDGNGVRFWSQDYYKIHMGRGADYQYGSVTDYSIKFNMNNDPTRGWTWGVHGLVPIASLNTQGIFKVSSSFYAGPLLGNTNAIGRISISGPTAEFSLVNRDVSTFVDSPINGERWVLYNQGASDGKLRFWSGGDKLVMTKDAFLGVGTSTPEAKLTINQTGNGWNDGLRINRDASNYLTLTEDQTDIRLKNWGSGGILFFNSAAEVARIAPNGNVGIGTSSPAAKLDVNGAIAVNGVGVITSGGNDVYANVRVLRNTSTQLTDGLYLGYNGSGGPIRFFSNSGTNELMTLTTSGYLGIGTTAPTQKLTVNGTIYGKEVKVDLNVPGPDYVFEKDHKLPSLDEIKSYIDQHKHLPEVPSAKEMEQNGINVSEMNMILLKKVEELTLFVISQKNENEELRTSLKKLEAEFKNFKDKK
jgi:hypothetical protein